MNKLSLIFLATVLAGCAAHNPELKSEQAEFAKQVAKLETLPPTNFWRAYKLPELNLAIENLTADNLELQQLALNFKLANLAVADAANGVDFSAQAGAGRNFELKGDKNQSHSYSASVGAAYEFDLWRKLAKQQDASKARAAATQFDYQALLQLKRRALISNYFDWCLNQEKLAITRANLARREQIKTLSKQQFKLGKTAIDSYHHNQTALLRLANELRNLELQSINYQSALADLLNLNSIAKLPISPTPILEIPQANIDLQAPLYVIGRRPDLQSAASTARAYNLELDSNYKNWFPQLSLSAGLTAAATALKAIGTNPVAALGLQLKLPFLNPQKLQREQQSSQLRAQNAMLTFAAKFNNSLLEAETRHAKLKLARADFANSEAIYNNAKLELARQLQRFNLGKIDLLSKLLAEIDCANSLLELQNAKRAYMGIELEMLLALG